LNVTACYAGLRRLVSWPRQMPRTVERTCRSLPHIGSCFASVKRSSIALASPFRANQSGRATPFTLHPCWLRALLCPVLPYWAWTHGFARPHRVWALHWCPA